MVQANVVMWIMLCFMVSCFELECGKNKKNVTTEKKYEEHFNEVLKNRSLIDYKGPRNGDTLLNYYVNKGDFDKVTKLIELGASWLIKNDQGKNPLFYLMKRSDEKWVTFRNRYMDFVDLNVVHGFEDKTVMTLPQYYMHKFKMSNTFFRHFFNYCSHYQSPHSLIYCLLKTYEKSGSKSEIIRLIEQIKYGIYSGLFFPHKDHSLWIDFIFWLRSITTTNNFRRHWVISCEDDYNIKYALDDLLEIKQGAEILYTFAKAQRMKVYTVEKYLMVNELKTAEIYLNFLIYRGNTDALALLYTRLYNEEHVEPSQQILQRKQMANSLNDLLGIKEKNVSIGIFQEAVVAYVYEKMGINMPLSYIQAGWLKYGDERFKAFVSELPWKTQLYLNSLKLPQHFHDIRIFYKN